MLWQPKIWVICSAGNPNLRFLSGSGVKRMLFHMGQEAEGPLYPLGIVIVDMVYS